MGPTASGAAEFLFEREDTEKALDQLLEAATDGRGGALWLVGAAGMGKTALMSATSRMAGSQVTVLSAQGAALEADLALAYAEQFLGSFLPQEGAVDPLSSLAVAYEAARSRLRYQAASGPVLVLLDDMHWADPESLRVIAYLARRISYLGVALVGAMRPWPEAGLRISEELSGQGVGAVIEVPALSPGASDRMVAELVGGEVPARTLGQVRSLARGNPLVVGEAARVISEGEDLAGENIGTQASLARPLLLRMLAGVPETAVACAQACSVLGARVQLSTARELAHLEDGSFSEGVEALVGCQVLAEDGAGWVRFSHQLVLSAIYDDLPPARRAQLHSRAFAYFAALGAVGQAAPHAVGAGLLGDARAVQVLIGAGSQALRRGAVESGLSQIASAIDLAGPEPGNELLGLHADSLFAAGRAAEAVTAYRRLLERSFLPLERIEVLEKLARAQLYSAELDQAMSNHGQVIALAREVGHVLPLSFWLDWGHLYWERWGPKAALQLLEDAPEEMSSGPGGAIFSATRGYYGLCCGDSAGLAAIEAAFEGAVEAAARYPAAAVSSGYAATLMAAAWYLAESFDQALELIAEAEGWLRSAGGRDLIPALRMTRLGVLRDQGNMLSVLLEVDDIEEQLGVHPLWAGLVPGTRAHALIWMGRLAEAESLIDAAEADPPAHLNRIDNLMNRCRLLVAKGSWEAASVVSEEIESLVASMGIGEPCQPMWASEAIEAYLGAGRTEDVARVVDWLERHSTLSCALRPKMVAMGGRAALAALAGDSDGAAELYRQALAMPCPTPLERVRVGLRYGTWLRQRGRAVEARGVLSEMLEVAEDCGAGLLVERAKSELSAAGGRRARRRQPGALTAQQAGVAKLAVGGATTKEIAAELYLSPRTVESHLAAVYLKLGVASRAELRLQRDKLGS